jgi:hypothetical protein
MLRVQGRPEAQRQSSHAHLWASIGSCIRAKHKEKDTTGKLGLCVSMSYTCGSQDGHGVLFIGPLKSLVKGHRVYN